jgi:uncharacterized 2Fe-2S/4Fe-4S cluster protein (DUF4445 family)
MPDSDLSSAQWTVEFQPSGRRVAAGAGATLLDVARSAGLGLLSVCGGAGLCDSCRVRVVRGDVSAPSAHERDVLEDADLQAGCRLACQVQVRSDIVVDVPAESIGTEQRLQLESDAGMLELAVVDSDGPVRAAEVTVPRPHLGDLRSDVDRLREACRELGVAIGPVAQPVVAQLPGALRALDWSVRVAFSDDGLVGVLPPKTPLFGLAVDVGTTKLAAFLVDLGSRRTVASEGAMNPQVTYGEDVISRIAYADRTVDGAQTLHTVLTDTLNEMVARLCAAVAVDASAVVDAVIVGNTAMHHLACGFPVAQLGRAPYVPAVGGAVRLPARDIGLRLAPGASVYLPPNIAGYVGADHVAVLLAVGRPSVGRTRLVIDIGTNTEISLLTADRIASCSCASGPAFEGAHVGCGMRAVAGAIERVRVVGGDVRCQTIGGKPAIGICGSGVLDAVAQLAAHGALDRHGGFRRGHPLVSSRGEDRVLVLAPAAVTGHNRELVLTRRDVTEIQLAKAAIRTGIELLLARTGIAGDTIDEVIVAGAFGSYLDLSSARRIGMLPDLPAGRFRQVGNAAGAGARQLLVSTARRRACEALAAGVEYIDLTTDRRFTETFATALAL